MSITAIAPAKTLTETNIVPLHEQTTVIHAKTNTSQPAASKPASKSAKPVANFQYRGKVWRIFKRRNPTAEETAKRLAGPPWQIYFEHEGKRNLWSLKFGEKSAAIAKAKALLDSYFDGEAMPKPVRAPACTATLGDVFAKVSQITSMDAAAAARAAYIWGTRYLFKLALGLSDAGAVDKLPLTVLDAEHGRKIFAAARKQIAGCQSQAEANSMRTNILSAWSNVHALFSVSAVESLKLDLDITVPATVVDFRQARKLAKFDGKGSTAFAAPDARLLRRTFRAWLRLGRSSIVLEYPLAGQTQPRRASDLDRRNLFLALGLAISSGLRCGETKQIRWRHFTQDISGAPYLSTRGDVDVKNHSAEIHVRPLDPFWRLMLRIATDNGWIGAPDDYVLAQRPAASVRTWGMTEFDYDRTHWPFWFGSQWLRRSMGWKLQKTNHALRDCAGSLVTMKFGLTRAKTFCRHASVQTTESHYGRFVSDEMMDNPKLLRWLKWAVVFPLKLK